MRPSGETLGRHGDGSYGWGAAQARGWELYLAGERQMLARSAGGGLANALRSTLPGESREQLDRLAEEDRRLARSGLVRLVAPEGEVSYKHVEDLTPADVPARRRAEAIRLDWLMRRTDRLLELLGVELNCAHGVPRDTSSPETSRSQGCDGVVT